MIKDEIKNIKQSPKDLRKFGLTVGIILLLISCLLIWNHKPTQIFFLSIGAILFLAGLLFPTILRPLNKAWMTLAILLRSEEHTSELQSLRHLVCRLLL